MLKKIYVTYLVPFKTISVKESEELQRFFDSVSESDYQFFNINKLLTDEPIVTEQHATSMQKLVPMDYTTVGDDTIVVIDFSRFFEDSVNWSDAIQKFDIEKGLNDSINQTEKLKFNSTKLLKDDFYPLDEFSKVVNYFRAKDDTVVMGELITRKDSGKVLNDSLYGMFDTIAISSQDYEYAEVYINDLVNRTVQYVRKFTTDFVTTTEAIQTKNFGKNFLTDPTTTSEAIQKKDSTKLLSELPLSATDRPFILTSRPVSDNTYPITDILTRIVSYIRTLNDTASITEQLKRDSTKLLSELPVSITDLAQKTPAKTFKDSVLYQPDEDMVVSRNVYSGPTFIRTENSYIKINYELVPVTDAVSVLPNYLKKDTFLYQPDEDLLISKDTYIDAQYYSSDYVDSTNSNIKILYELIGLTDKISIVPSPLKKDSITAGDVGGNMLNNTYIESGYMSGNYIGTLISF